MTLVVLLACFVLFLPCFSPCSLISLPPPALCRYLLPRLCVVSSVQQLYVPLQHVCCSLCSLSDLLASRYSELLSAFFLVFCLFRPCAGIFFLVFVLFRPCSSYMFLFSTYVVLLAAFLIFLHYILQNSCRLLRLFSYYFPCFSRLACFVVFSYQVR